MVRIAGRKKYKKHKLSASQYGNTSTVCGQTAPFIAKALTVTFSRGVQKGKKITLNYITAKKVCENKVIIRIGTNIFFS